MANSLKLTRNQLAGFLKDFEQIKQFEKLFSLSEDYLNSGMIDGIAIEAGNATAAAYAVAAALQELSEELANEPPAVDLSTFEARLQALEQLPPVADDGLASRVEALEIAPRQEVLDWRGLATGWGAYVHGGGAQTLVGGVAEPLENDAGTILETQKPYDIDTFYDGTVITGRTGDGVAIGIEFTFTPSSGAATVMYVAIDIGGGVGEIYAMEFPIMHGSAVAHKISYNVVAYTLDTWEANGGTVIVNCDGAGDITGTRYVIHRTHRAIK